MKTEIKYCLVPLLEIAAKNCLISFQPALQRGLLLTRAHTHDLCDAAGKLSASHQHILNMGISATNAYDLQMVATCKTS